MINIGVIVRVSIVGHSLAVDVARLMLLVEELIMSLIVLNTENSRHSLSWLLIGAFLEIVISTSFKRLIIIVI